MGRGQPKRMQTAGAAIQPVGPRHDGAKDATLVGEQCRCCPVLDELNGGFIVHPANAFHVGSFLATMTVAELELFPRERAGSISDCMIPFGMRRIKDICNPQVLPDAGAIRVDRPTKMKQGRGEVRNETDSQGVCLGPIPQDRENETLGKGNIREGKMAQGSKRRKKRDGKGIQSMLLPAD